MAATNMARSPWCGQWIVAALLGWMLVVDVASSWHLSITYDEPRHFRYGQQILAGDASRFDDSKMPFSALNAVSSALVSRALGRQSPNERERVAAGRYATMLFALVAALCVWRWATDLYGPTSGLLALGLYAVEPSLLAHSQLVTTDIYATGALAWALYGLWRYLRTPTRGWALGSAALIALAQLAKYTAIFLYPLSVLIALGFHGGDLVKEVRRGDWTTLRRRGGVAVRYSVLVALVSVAVVNVGFLFDRTMTPLGGYAFRSELFRGLQASGGPLNVVPVPVPYPYLEGLDWIVRRERTGEGYGSIYLLGQVRQAQGFVGYFLVAVLYKVPGAILLVWLVLAGSLVLRRGPPDQRRHEWVLLCPLVFFTVYFNVFYRAQLGLRFFLVVFPLLFVLSGRLVREWASTPRWTRAAWATLGVYLLGSVLSYYPHLLPYFNELVGDRKLAYRILADSNLDWGQHLWYQAAYEAAHPGLIIEPDGPTAGNIVVGANALTGVAGDPGRFRWLRDHFAPVDHIAYSTLVYHVTQADLERAGLRPAAQGGR